MNNSCRDKALSILKNTDASFVYVTENTVLTSEFRGIRRLLTLVNEQTVLADGFVADRIVGKAAALLMVLQGAKNVYAETIDKPALAVFRTHGVNVMFRKAIPIIINRSGDGICPMENAVLAIDDPKEAFTVLSETVKKLINAPKASFSTHNA